MSGGSNSLALRVYAGGVRFFSALGAATYVSIRTIANPASNLDIKLLTALPASTKVLTIDQNGQIAVGASDGTGGGGGEANTASSPSAAANAIGIYWKKVGADLQFYKLLPLNTPALTIAQGIDTLDISIANAIAAGNAGLMTGADKTKLDGISSGATVGATWGTNLNSIPARISAITSQANPGAAQFFQLNTDGSVTFVNLSTLQPANARLGAIAGFTNPATVKIVQIGTDGVASLIDPPSGFNPGSQSANFFYASPNGAAGNPGFRALVYGDIASLAGTGASNFAVGNDSRFHTQGTDTGTTATSFLIDSAGTPIRIKDVAGEVQFRNGADTANAPVRLGDVIITGQLQVTGATQISPETVQVQDNIIEINADFVTGTPSQDLGIVGKRGGSVDAEMLFNEATDIWECGTTGNRFRMARSRTFNFTSANVTSGIVTIPHNLGGRPSGVAVWDNNGEMIGLIDRIIYVDVNTIQLDITNAGTITGTWAASITV